MPQAPAQTIPKTKKRPMRVKDFDSDGVTLDTTEALQCFTSSSIVATATVDPANNRRVFLNALSEGSATITVTAPGVVGGNALTVQVTVSPPPDLSRIELDGFDPDE